MLHYSDVPKIYERGDFVRESRKDAENIAETNEICTNEYKCSKNRMSINNRGSESTVKIKINDLAKRGNILLRTNKLPYFMYVLAM